MFSWPILDALLASCRKRATTSGLAGLDELTGQHDRVHVQNVMNPVALKTAVDTGRAIVTVQDHRVFCPGPGKTLPDGTRCHHSMSAEACALCLDDEAYR